MAEEPQTIGVLGNRLEKAEDKLVLVITGEVYNHLKRFSTKMKAASNPREVVEVALELLVRAEDKEIAIIDEGNIVATFNLWR
jgi:hypothetical protein